jgi:hypothetical protein
MIDLIGGEVEEGETPEEAIVRETGEELIDLRTGRAFVLVGHKLFLSYVDKRGCEQSIFVCDVDLEIADLRLLEGQELTWIQRHEIESGFQMAYEFEEVLKQFFVQRPLQDD